MAKRFQGIRELRRNRVTLWKRIAGETGRVVKNVRKSAAKDVTTLLRSRRLVSARFTAASARRWFHNNPRPDKVTVDQLFRGVSRNSRVTAWPVPLHYLRVKTERITDRLGRKRYLVVADIGGQRHEYRGAFLVVSQRWTPSARGKFVSLYRTGERKAVEAHRATWENSRTGRVRKRSGHVLAVSQGPGVAELLAIAGVDEQLQRDAVERFEALIRDRCGRVVGRFEAEQAKG